MESNQIAGWWPQHVWAPLLRIRRRRQSQSPCGPDKDKHTPVPLLLISFLFNGKCSKRTEWRRHEEHHHCWVGGLSGTYPATYDDRWRHLWLDFFSGQPWCVLYYVNCHWLMAFPFHHGKYRCCVTEQWTATPQMEPRGPSQGSCWWIKELRMQTWPLRSFFKISKGL